MTDSCSSSAATVDNNALATVLGNLSARAVSDRHNSEAYKKMARCTSIGEVVRAINDASTSTFLDAFDVLQNQLNLDGTHELYDYLHEIPHRFQRYRAAFNAETHVGCVDRTVAKIVDEVKAAAQPGPRPIGTRSRRAQHAALVTGTDEAMAEDVLIIASLADDGQRIQRLSNDARRIAAEITAMHPELPAEGLYGTVRLILGTAANIVHEQDGFA